MALGASRGDVLRLVVMQGLRLTLMGVAFGLAASFAATRLIASLLYGVSPTDVVTFTVVPLLLAAAALLRELSARAARDADRSDGGAQIRVRLQIADSDCGLIGQIDRTESAINGNQSAINLQSAARDLQFRRVVRDQRATMSPPMLASRRSARA